MDHRHYAIWMWTHHNSLTDNSEASIESSFSENSDPYRMGDSPRLLPSSPSSYGRMAPNCSPSTSFATSSVMDVTSPLLSSSLLSMPPQMFRQAPPPPYTPRHHPHPPHEALFRMHNTPVILEPDCDLDIDVVGLSETTKEVSLNDRDEMNDDEKPLDLSMRHSPSAISPACRPSVIMDVGSCRSSPSLRRSASSAASVDVSDHFRRSLSGKWPKKCKSDEEKARSSPFRRHTSFNSHAPASPVVIKTSGAIDIEDHFRRALGDDFDKAFKQNKDQINQTIS